MDYSNNTWKVIDNYFKSTKNYLTAHHLDSFNDFITNKIPQTLKQYNPQIHYKEYNKDNDFYKNALQSGFDTAERIGWGDFEVACTVTVIPGEDIEQCADLLRPMIALYAGGMGAKGQNFHYDVFARMGYEEACEKIQELYLAGNKKDAIAAVPTEMVEAISLIGPPAKIKDELSLWEESVVNTMLISGGIDLVRFVYDLVS